MDNYSETISSTITACIVIYNEEAVLERCLESIVDVVDEIIIIHDGQCSDNSINISKKFTNKVYIGERVGMCEPHRVNAYNMATSEWILQIDADEYLSVELKAQLRVLVKEDSIDAYEFIWPYCDGKVQFTRKHKFPYRLCLARRDRAYYWGFPHESLKVNGKTTRVNLVLEHWPRYDNYNLKTFVKKQIPWIKIHGQFMWKNVDEIKRYNVTDASYLDRLQLAWRNKHILLIPYIFIKYTVLQLYSGQWKVGLNGYKVSVVVGAYHALLMYYSRKRIVQ